MKSNKQKMFQFKMQEEWESEPCVFTQKKIEQLINYNKWKKAEILIVINLLIEKTSSKQC